MVRQRRDGRGLRAAGPDRESRQCRPTAGAVIANINSYSQAVVGAPRPRSRGRRQGSAGRPINATRIPGQPRLPRRSSRRPPSPSRPLCAGSTWSVPRSRPSPMSPASSIRSAPAPTSCWTISASRSPPWSSSSRPRTALYAAGARVFVEVAPRRLSTGFVEDVLGTKHDDVVALYTNHPKLADDVAINQALCGLYAAGLGFDARPSPPTRRSVATTAAAPAVTTSPSRSPPRAHPALPPRRVRHTSPVKGTAVSEHASPSNRQTLRPGSRPGPRGVCRGPRLQRRRPSSASPARCRGPARPHPRTRRRHRCRTQAARQAKMFDDANVARILAGENFISSVPAEVRQLMMVTTGSPGSSDASGWRQLSDHRRPRRCHQARLAPTRRSMSSPRFGVDKAVATRPRHDDLDGDLRRARRPPVTPASRWSCATRRPRSAPNCPTGGPPGVAARRHRHHLRVGVPGLCPLRRGTRGLYGRPGRREASRPRGRAAPSCPATTRPAPRSSAPDRPIRESIDHANPSELDRRFRSASRRWATRVRRPDRRRGLNTHVNPPAPARPRPSRSPRTGSAPASAAGHRRRRRRRHRLAMPLLPGSLPASLITGATATDSGSRTPPRRSDRRRHGDDRRDGAAAVVVESAVRLRARPPHLRGAG